MALDYAAIMHAGQNLVPDLQTELLKRQQMEYQQGALKEQIAQRQIAQQQAQDKQARTEAFRVAVAQAVQSGDPHAIPRLMVRFPEFADQIKPGWDAMSADGKARNLSQLGTIIARAQGGDMTGAATLLEQRIASDKAAGQDTSEDERGLAMLRSENPQDRAGALAALRMAAFAADPKGYKDMADAAGIEAPKTTDTQREYDWRVATFGKANADKWLAVQSDKFVPVEGKGVYRASDLIPDGELPPMPGIISGYGGGTWDIAPGGGMIQRTPVNPSQSEGGDQSTGMGGVPAPALGANGFPEQLTPDQYRVTVQSLGKAKTDEWMARNGITISGGQSGPVRVRSKQEYDRLPRGAEYIAPDGSHRRKN